MSFKTTKHRQESISLLVGTEVIIMLFSYSIALYDILRGRPLINYLLMGVFALHLCTFAYLSWRCDPDTSKSVPHHVVPVHIAINAFLIFAFYFIAALLSALPSD